MKQRRAVISWAMFFLFVSVGEILGDVITTQATSASDSEFERDKQIVTEKIKHMKKSRDRIPQMAQPTYRTVSSAGVRSKNQIQQVLTKEGHEMRKDLESHPPEAVSITVRDKAGNKKILELKP